MVGGVLYYLMLFVITLAIGVFNITQFGAASTTVCYSIVTIPADAAGGSNTSQITFAGGLTGTPDSVNLYKILSLIIAFGYFAITFFSLIMTFVINMMSNMVPDDFLNVSKCKKCLACFTKILPPCLVVIHYIIMILIAVNWIMIAMESCKYSMITGAYTPDPTNYFRQTNIQSIVNSIFWIVIHFCGSLIRDNLYQEPFMYSPQVGKPTLGGTIFKKIGP